MAVERLDAIETHPILVVTTKAIFPEPAAHQIQNRLFEINHRPTEGRIARLVGSGAIQPAEFIASRPRLDQIGFQGHQRLTGQRFLEGQRDRDRASDDRSGGCAPPGAPSGDVHWPALPW